MKTSLFIILTFVLSAMAQANSSTGDAYSKICLSYIQKSQTYGGSASRDEALCAKMTSRPKAFCVGFMILDRVNNLRSRGWAYAPSYQTMDMCSQIDNIYQYDATHALITDYSRELDRREISIALRADTKDKSECFVSMVSEATSLKDLEACVD